MGLCIYYRGQIKDATSLPHLIEEVKDIVNIYRWKYEIDERSFPNNTLDNQENLESIYGISFTPSKCETISLTFLSNGVMVCPTRVLFFGNSKNETERNYIYHLSAKTQFAGMATHAIIINLFRYLSNKYLSDFEMKDESGYWETADENVLRENFKAYDALLDNFTLSLQTFPVKKGETMFSYFERLLKHINKLKKS